MATTRDDRLPSSRRVHLDYPAGPATAGRIGDEQIAIRGQNKVEGGGEASRVSDLRYSPGRRIHPDDAAGPAAAIRADDEQVALAGQLSRRRRMREQSRMRARPPDPIRASRLALPGRAVPKQLWARLRVIDGNDGGKGQARSWVGPSRWVPRHSLTKV